MSPEARGYAAYGGHAKAIPIRSSTLQRLLRLHQRRRPRAAAAFPTFETGHEEMLLCDAIARSAKERRWVKMA